MKDIIIPSTLIRKELIWFLASFILSVIFNIYSIIRYDSAWKELITQIHVVLILSVIFYFMILLVRLLARLILKMVKR